DPWSFKMYNTINELGRHGKLELQIVLDHYAANCRLNEPNCIGVDTEIAKGQYEGLKTILFNMSNSYDDVKSKTQRIYMSTYNILSNHYNDFQCICNVLKMILLIETSIIDNERVHSVRKLIEADQRQTLLPCNLDAILRLKYNGTDTN